MDFFGELVINLNEPVNFILDFEKSFGIFVGLFGLFIGGFGGNFLTDHDNGKKN